MVISDSAANLGMTGSNKTTKSLWFKNFCKLKNSNTDKNDQEFIYMLF